MNVVDQAKRAHAAARQLSLLTAEEKNAILIGMAEKLKAAETDLLNENALDVQSAIERGLSDAFVDRLRLTHDRIEQMEIGLMDVARLPDPVGELMERWERPNGLIISKVRVPLGVIGIIYESRPNVTVDAAALCLKSGNACFLRGGSDAARSNIAIEHALHQALPESLRDCVQVIRDTSREAANQMMHLNEWIDVLIPRGGAGLIQSVVQQATVPVIQTGTGNCHVYVHQAADLDMALRIAVTAKISRPATCNAEETLLVDEVIAEAFLPICIQALKDEGVEVRGCSRTRAIVPSVIAANDEDWDTEYNDKILAVRVVDGIDQALDHIHQHGTRHSEAIITQDEQAAQRFVREVDAAAVYWNASTRFTDGFEFGFGAEIGISNQKLHARGPMGLRELTSVQYRIEGQGQVR